jgi:hypothetical protein
LAERIQRALRRALPAACLLGATTALFGCSRPAVVPVSEADRKVQLEQQVQKIRSDSAKSPQERQRDEAIFRSLSAASGVRGPSKGGGGK